MEELIVRYIATKKALKTLNRSLKVLKDPNFSEVYDELRDSVIQRFEYSIDTLWKLLKEFLFKSQKIVVEPSSPKAIFQACLNAKFINDQEYKIAIEMIESRNLTSHTYNELFAEEMVSRIPKYFKLMNAMLKRMNISSSI